jgi:hypothetical protein
VEAQGPAAHTGIKIDCSQAELFRSSLPIALKYFLDSGPTKAENADTDRGAEGAEFDDVDTAFAAFDFADETLCLTEAFSYLSLSEALFLAGVSELFKKEGVLLGIN